MMLIRYEIRVSFKQNVILCDHSSVHQQIWVVSALLCWINDNQSLLNGSRQIDLFRESGKFVREWDFSSSFCVFVPVCRSTCTCNCAYVCVHVRWKNRVLCPEPVIATLKVHLQNSWLQLVPASFLPRLSLFPVCRFSIHLCCNSCMSSKPITSPAWEWKQEMLWRTSVSLHTDKLCQWSEILISLLSNRISEAIKWNLISTLSLWQTSLSLTTDIFIWLAASSSHTLRPVISLLACVLSPF